MFRVSRNPWISALLIGLMLLIFTIDTFSPLDMAIAVMYVVVVLMSAAIWQRRGVLLASASCIALTVLSYALTHSAVFSAAASGRLLVGLLAISVTCVLVLRGQAATHALLAREQALHRSQVQLAHATRVTMLGELAASIAHEVNQPLAAITTNGEACLRWMNRPQPELDEAKASVTGILEASARATGVIKRIRALARRSDPQYVALDLQTVVEESVDMVRRELNNHHVALMLRLTPELPPVTGDRVQLHQVFINLLMNAIQAMAACQPGQALLTLQTRRNADGALQVSISDSGPGIPASVAPRLFEAFYSTKDDGMGMGLPICRSIIESHGGRIWVSQASADLPMTGAAILFTLPVHEPD